MRRPRDRSEGFSLFELMISIGIMAILVLNVTTSVDRARRIAWDTRARSALHNLTIISDILIEDFASDLSCFGNGPPFICDNGVDLRSYGFNADENIAIIYLAFPPGSVGWPPEGGFSMSTSAEKNEGGQSFCVLGTGNVYVSSSTLGTFVLNNSGDQGNVCPI